MNDASVVHPRPVSGGMDQDKEDISSLAGEEDAGECGRAW